MLLFYCHNCLFIVISITVAKCAGVHQWICWLTTCCTVMEICQLKIMRKLHRSIFQVYSKWLHNGRHVLCSLQCSHSKGMGWSLPFVICPWTVRYQYSYWHTLIALCIIGLSNIITYIPHLENIAVILKHRQREHGGQQLIIHGCQYFLEN